MLDLLRQPVTQIRVTATKNDRQPPPGFRWLILSGVINHIGGTNSSLYISIGGVNVAPIGFVDTGRGSGPYNACAVNGLITGAEERLTFNGRILLLTNAEKIHLDGGTGVGATLHVIQFAEGKK